ncbi:MAG: YhjD/YihY/BrkB family envelope integrity protein, partial [Planctomycetota bacterium]
MLSFIAWYVREVCISLQMAARRWQLDDAGAMAAAVAYYLALSVFPILLLLSSGLGLFLKFTNLGHDAEVQILAVVAEHCSPSLEQQIRVMLLQFEEQSIVGGPFGLLTAIAAAIGVFYQFDRAFDKIWRVPPTATSLGDRIRFGDLAPQASIGNPSVATASTTPGVAASGTYSLEVTQLAQSQTLVSQSYGAPNDLVGEGSLTIRFGE